MILLLFIACTGSSHLPITQSTPLEAETAIFTSVSMDYSVGSLSSITTDTLEISQDISSVSGDPALRYEGGSLWQLNRYQYDTIRKYDPENLTVPTHEISVAPETGSSNPHDVAICNDQLFVSQFELAEILILDPETMIEIDRIDISEFADDDNRTEASSLVLLQDKLYLGLQGLNRDDGYSYAQASILEVDCSLNEISNSWEFGINIQLYDWKEDQLLISSYQGEDSPATLFSFQPETETFEEVLQSEGDISALATAGDQIAFISSNSATDPYQVHCFDGESWNKQTDFLEYLPDIQINQNNEIWVTAHWGWLAPNQATSGIYRFDSGCQALDPERIELNLAPNSLVFVTPQ